MATTTTTPRLSKPPQSDQINRTFNLSAITSAGNGSPHRYIMHGVEGIGKSSFGAQCPKPVFIQTKGEDGLETLINAGRIGPTPHFPQARTWTEVLGYVRALIDDPHDYRTLVIDTLNGAERVCHEYVCHVDFNDEWGEKGFSSYQKGPEVSLNQWRIFLTMLDELREKRKMTIFALCHTKVAKFTNPLGADYDRFQPDVDKRTWSLTAKWSDAVLFSNFETTVSNIKENKKTGDKGKGIGGKIRVMYTERDAAYDAKNRLGLPPEIEMGDSPEEAWSNFLAALKQGRKELSNVQPAL